MMVGLWTPALVWLHLTEFLGMNGRFQEFWPEEILVRKMARDHSMKWKRSEELYLGVKWVTRGESSHASDRTSIWPISLYQSGHTFFEFTSWDRAEWGWALPTIPKLHAGQLAGMRTVTRTRPFGGPQNPHRKPGSHTTNPAHPTSQLILSDQSGDQVLGQIPRMVDNRASCRAA